MNEEKPNDILILGCCYTPEIKDDYEGPYYRYDEINNDLVESIKGKSVYIEHDIEDDDGDKRPPIGKVVDAYVNSNGQVMSFLHITGDDVASSLLPHGLAADKTGKRYYNDLSLGHCVQFGVDKDKNSVSIKGKIPEEVSIVRNGDRPDTRIHDYWFLPHKTDENYVKRIIPEYIK